ncbi:hypothetical protein ACI8AC_23745 [Geodermatophilus sp. SYSU D00758]
MSQTWNGPNSAANGARPRKIATAKSLASVTHSRASGDSWPSATLAELGRILRDEGTARANGNADAWWADCFDRAVDYLAATGHEWTTDDVFTLGVPPADHPNRVGARVRAAYQAGLIRPTGYRTSARPSRHAGVVRVWVGGAAA